MTFWKPRQIGLFLVIWTLLWPTYIVMIFHNMSTSILVYAALWGYLLGYPLWDSPFGVDVLLTLMMLPFCVPGFVIAYFAYRTTRNQDLSRGTYLLAMVVLQVIHMAVIWLIMPHTISSDPVLCLPAPVTGFVAMPFARKLDRLTVPWEKKAENESL